MKLETKNKTVNLVLKTKKIVDIANSLGNKNFEDAYFKAVQGNDLDALSKIIYTLAETEDGKHAFGTSYEVYDFIDEYKTENNKTYSDIYKELSEAINDEGFFMKKMTKKELTEMISDPLSRIDMNEIVEKSASKAIEKVAEAQFTGFQA